MTWGDASSLERVRSFYKSPEYVIDNKPTNGTVIEGVLWGGCLEVLEFLKGTPYWFNEVDSFKNLVIFFELSDEEIAVKQIRWIMRNYGIQGVFKNASAIMFGRLPKATNISFDDFRKTIYEVVHTEFNSSIPLVYNLDIGHTSPQLIFPIGINVKINFTPSVNIKVMNPFSKLV
jgi:muramoyltetrapeptide carboxypeptidase LdcA involved in peptidoglycan recycling